MKLTVIYTDSNQWGTIVHSVHVDLKKDQLLYSLLEAGNIDPGSVVRVFHGWHDSICSDWSTLKG